ncbi:MAG: TonB-dependent receptor [Bacteroidetes bacterium]|nr:MAG: TonB-dependent receptor [Bacteroidota bacterium]
MTNSPLLKQLTACLFLPFLPVFLAAQAPVPVTSQLLVKGRVVDAQTRVPLEFATVALYSSTDSSVIGGGLTESDGAFQIKAREGVFFLKIDFLAYTSLTVGDIRLTKDEPVADLGFVALEPAANRLDEVVVRAEKSAVQMSLDKRVFNVGKDLANRGGTAAEILDNVPSVNVDVEGNVSLRGSGGVRILIDGRPSGLVGISNTNGLRQLPANLIDRVEVITNPSARYEAEGMAGIINIVLKKEQANGLNGAVDLTVGNPDQYGASINLNYRKNKLNLFSNYGLRYRKSPGTGSQYQEFYTGDTTFITELTRNRERGGWSNSLRLGADYFINPQNSLTTAFSWRYSNEDNFSEIVYRDFFNSINNPTGTVRRTDDEKEIEPNLEYNLNYKRTFERDGHELVADVRFQDNTEQENSDFRERSFAPDGAASGAPDFIQRSENKEGQRNLIMQVDYVHPFGEEGRFELGYRGGLRDIRNDFQVEELNGTVWSTLPGLTNNFIYDENIHAGYAILGNKIQKFSWQGGLRLEVSDVKTELLQTNEVNDRPIYSNLFPSAHVGYELPGGHAVQISYSRRIRRPRFWDLNPFFTYSDARNFRSGNPNLNPEFTDAYEISHLVRWEKGTLSSAIYHRHTDDVFERIRIQLSDTSSLTFPVNLSTQNDFGLEFTGSYEPLEFWKINGNLNFFRSITKGTYEGQEFNADTYTWSGRVSSRISLWKKVDIQKTFNYRAPRNTTQGRSKAMYHLDLAASMDILKSKGTLTLSVQDVFNTRRWRYITEGVDFYTEGDFQWRARQVNLTFSYRINRSKEQRKDRDMEGGGENGGGMEF